MTFTEAARSVWQQTMNFSGRARRSEFWWFQLASILVIGLVMAAFIVATLLLRNGTIVGVVLGAIMSLIILGVYVRLIVASLAVLVRRLHDTGRSGWWYFISLVPLVGSIVLLVFLVQESQSGPNRWGQSPTSSWGGGPWSDQPGPVQPYLGPAPRQPVAPPPPVARWTPGTGDPPPPPS